MGTADNRVVNLRRMRDGYNTQREMAEDLGLDASFLSQLMTGHRRVGEKVARGIEEALGLPMYALDQEDPDSLKYQQIEESISMKADPSLALEDAGTASGLEQLQRLCQRLIHAYRSGSLDDDDLVVLSTMVDRLVR